MPAKDTKKSAVVSVYADGMTALPACILGFNAFFEPQEYEGKETFDANVHFTPAAIGQLTGILQLGMDALLDDIAHAAAEKGSNMKPADPYPVEEWLEDKLKPVTNPDHRIQLPYLKLKMSAYRKGNANRGEPERVLNPPKFWPATGGKLLDIKKLNLGMGSTVIPLVFINLFRAKEGKDCPVISLKLAGFRVLHRQARGGGFAPEESDDAAIQAALGGTVEVDDLSEFMATEEHTDQHSEGAAPPAAGATPEDLAEGMF